jgi:hypothetical protein
MDRQISDDHGKKLGILDDAYDHAQKLINKILRHVGSDDGKVWKVVVLSCADHHSIPSILITLP